MYEMVSADGATYRTAATESFREELESLGYKVVEQEKKPRKAAKKVIKDDGE